jgi:DNA polymerase-1
VPKVGEKTATQLIVDYGSVDGVYAHIDEIKKPALRKTLSENEDLARLSLFLVTIKTDCDILTDWEEARIGNLYTPEAFALFTELNFRAFLPRFDTAAAEQGNEELSIETISELSRAKEYMDSLSDRIRKASKEHPLAIGFYPSGGNIDYSSTAKSSVKRLCGAALSVGMDSVFIEAEAEGAQEKITENAFKDMLRELRLTVRTKCAGETAGDAETGREPASIAVFGIKNQYPVWGIDSADEFGKGIRLEGLSDLLIECYLSNPLQSDYQPEMTA